MSNKATIDPPAAKLPFRLRVALKTTKTFPLFSKVQSRASILQSRVANAFTLGLLNADHISRFVQYQYQSNPSYYDPGNYDYKWEEKIIEPLRNEIASSNMLVAFCGKGREARLFASHGYEVLGIDREEFMIQDAIKYSQALPHKIDYKCIDFDSFESAVTFDIVYTSTWMYTTYLDRSSRLAFLEKCKDLCDPKGVIVISYRIRKDNITDSIIHSIAKLTGLVTFGNQKSAKGDRIENGLFWHYFTEPEIDAELKAAGLETCFHKPSSDGKLEWRFLRKELQASHIQ